MTGDPSASLPPYATPPPYATQIPGPPPTVPPATGRGIASLVAGVLAGGIVVGVIVQFLVFTQLLATGSPTMFGAVGTLQNVIGAVLGLATVVAGVVGIASGRRVVLAGIATGVGASEVVGAFWLVAQLLVGVLSEGRW